jgi:hypothetical protein
LPCDLLPLAIAPLIDGQDENINIEWGGLNSRIRYFHGVLAIDDRTTSRTTS